MKLLMILFLSTLSLGASQQRRGTVPPQQKSKAQLEVEQARAAFKEMVDAQKKELMEATQGRIKVFDKNKQEIAQLDLTNVDLITQDEFSELIAEQMAHDDIYILARAVSYRKKKDARTGQDIQEQRADFFDAQALNEWMFKSYLKGNQIPQRLEGMPQHHPMGSEWTIATVDYFVFDPKNVSEGFTFLCELKDLRYGQRTLYWLTYFYAHQCKNPLAFKALRVLAGMYMRADHGVTRDMTESQRLQKKAVTCLQHIAHTHENMVVRMQALFTLAEYYKGMNDTTQSLGSLSQLVNTFIVPDTSQVTMPGTISSYAPVAAIQDWQEQVNKAGQLLFNALKAYTILFQAYLLEAHLYLDQGSKTDAQNALRHALFFKGVFGGLVRDKSNILAQAFQAQELPVLDIEAEKVVEKRIKEFKPPKPPVQPQPTQVRSADEIPLWVPEAEQKQEQAEDVEAKEFLDIVKEKDIYTQQSFKELIAERFSQDNDYILARVLSVGSGVPHYFDGHTMLKQIETESARTNPINRQPITEIQYYALDADELQKGFQYLFSVNRDELISAHDERRPILDAHRFLQMPERGEFIFDLERIYKQRCNARKTLINLYEQGTRFIKINPSKARRLQEKSAACFKEEREWMPNEAEMFIFASKIRLARYWLEQRDFEQVQNILKGLIKEAKPFATSLRTTVTHLHGLKILYEAHILLAKSYLQQPTPDRTAMEKSLKEATENFGKFIQLWIESEWLGDKRPAYPDLREQEELERALAQPLVTTPPQPTATAVGAQPFSTLLSQLNSSLNALGQQVMG